ncbi:ABC transporter permease [Candidatus Babeliales bacterium]|nr:ABC transporter permease [Candidatus Babeliales bacterium]
MKYIYDTNTYKTFLYMLLRSIKVTSPTITTRIINQTIWTTLNVLVFGHLMSQTNIGPFIAVTMATSVSFFIAIHCMYGLLFDVTSEGSSLRYELTLPTPQWTVFFKYALEYAQLSFIVSSIVLPLGYFLTKMIIPLSILALCKYYLLLLVVSLFSGAFSLFTVSITHDVAMDLDNLWVRVLFPMWFLGCFQFSWQDLYNISPILAYLDLLNPLTYALEGGRSAIMFTQSSLNYWLCLGMLCLFTILFLYLGIQKLKKRLDCL